MQVERITPLARLMDRLGPLDAESRIDAILGAIAGSDPHETLRFTPTQPGRSIVDLQLFGISASGQDLATACARWIAQASEQVDIVERVAAAWETLCDNTTDPDDARLACATILQHTDDPQLRAKAVDTLRSHFAGREMAAS